MKKLVMLLISVIMVFSLAACGSGNSGGTEKEKAVVTVEKYEALGDEQWGDMTKEEMEEFLGVKGVTDKENTASWGEGYEVVDFPGPDEDSYIHVLFQQKDDGRMTAASMSPVGVFAEY